MSGFNNLLEEVHINWEHKLGAHKPLLSHEYQDTGAVTTDFIIDSTGTAHQPHTEQILNLRMHLYCLTSLGTVPSEAGKATDVGLTKRIF